MSQLQHLFRFGIVGATTAALYYGLLYAGVELLALDAVLSSSAAYIIVIVANYLMHYSWTFAVSSPHTTALKRYLVMTGCGFFINGLIMYIGVSVLQLNYLLIQAIAMGVVILWNFCLSSLWVFRG
ncbi:MAG: GtrA family protein [Proteobacteria bacterium]|nr:GtrA family protein [Pseudomonadota bacterium]